MDYKKTILILSLIILFVGCRKDLMIDPNNISYTSDVEQFERVWDGLNTNYVMWGIDTTDWDRIYDKYHKVFSSSYMSDSIWKEKWEELTSSLIDHHLQIVLNRPTTGSLFSLFPGRTEVQKRCYYHPSINPKDCLDRMSLSGRLTDQEKTESFYYGMIDNCIAYLRITKFNITDLMSEMDLNQMNVFDKFKRAASNSQTKAVIVDLRSNPGGNANDLGILMSCFVTSPYLIGYTQEKIGLGRMDLGPHIPYRVIPFTNSQKVDCPIIALVDVNSASMAEISALSIKLLPNGYVVGERTYGATCALNPDTYADQFGTFGYPLDTENMLGVLIMSGHYVYTPKYLFTGVDGTCYEGYGIEPNKTCYFSQSDFDNGIDNQLECAIQFALGKSQ